MFCWKVCFQTPGCCFSAHEPLARCFESTLLLELALPLNSGAWSYFGVGSAQNPLWALQVILQDWWRLMGWRFLKTWDGLSCWIWNTISDTIMASVWVCSPTPASSWSPHSSPTSWSCLGLFVLLKLACWTLPLTKLELLLILFCPWDFHPVSISDFPNPTIFREGLRAGLSPSLVLQPIWWFSFLTNARWTRVSRALLSDALDPKILTEELLFMDECIIGCRRKRRDIYYYVCWPHPFLIVFRVGLNLYLYCSSLLFCFFTWCKAGILVPYRSDHAVHLGFPRCQPLGTLGRPVQWSWMKSAHIFVDRMLLFNIFPLPSFLYSHFFIL